MTPRPWQPAVRWLAPLLADLACVVAFSFGGKSSHEASASDWVLLTIAWPYALAAALAHAWIVARGGHTGRVWGEGAVIVVVTYVLGMVLRGVSGRGIAAGFLVVAGLFLALTMLGWRTVVALAASRRRPRAS